MYPGVYMYMLIILWILLLESLWWSLLCVFSLFSQCLAASLSAYKYIWGRSEKPCVKCATKTWVDLQGPVSHRSHAIPSHDLQYALLNTKKIKSRNRACDSIAHGDYQARSRYTRTLHMLLYFRKTCSSGLLRTHLGTTAQETLIKINMFKSTWTTSWKIFYCLCLLNVFAFANVWRPCHKHCFCFEMQGCPYYKLTELQFTVFFTYRPVHKEWMLFQNVLFTIYGFLGPTPNMLKAAFALRLENGARPYRDPTATLPQSRIPRGFHT